MSLSTFPAFTPSLPLNSSPKVIARRPRRPYVPVLCTSSQRYVSPSVRRAFSTRSNAQIATLLERHFSAFSADASVWIYAVSRLVSIKDWVQLERVLLLGIQQLSGVTLRLFIRPLLALAQSGQWTAVLNVLQTLWGKGGAVVPDERLLASLANVAVERRQHGIGVEILQTGVQYNVQMGVVGKSVLLKAYGRGGNVEGVRKVVRKMGRDVDAVLLNSAVDALVRVGEMEGAKRLLEVEWYEKLADVTTYNSLLKGMEWEEGLNWVERMKKRGVQPNKVTRNTLLSCFIRGGELERAREMMGKEEEDWQGVIGKTALIAGLARGGRVKEAEILLNEMQEVSEVTFAAVIMGCLEGGYVEEAIRIFEKVPMESKGGDVCHAMVIGLCKSGKRELIQRAWNIAKEYSQGVEVYNSLLDGALNNGWYKLVDRIWKDMKNWNKLNVQSFTILIKGYVEHGRVRKAKLIAEEVLNHDIALDRVALNTLVMIYIRTNELEKAHDLVRNASECMVGAMSYVPLLKASLKQSTSRGWKVYTEMRNRGIESNTYIIQAICSIICRNVGIKEAELFIQVIQDGIQDEVDVRLLRKWRRKILESSRDAHITRMLLRQLRIAQLESASEQIFTRHGWNEIDSGWRVI